MPKVRLIVEYDGSKFNGWQEQPNLRTLQGEIRKALSLVLREDINWVLASGRTDAGVHARAQTVVFKCEQTPDLDRLINGVSNILKNEVSILEASLAEDNFHPIKDAIKKHYRYTIYRPAAPPVLDFGKVWHVTRPLNLEIMQTSAKVIEGEHDFSSFRCSGCSSPNPVKKIFLSEIKEEGNYLIYDVIGSGFLKQMVRVIVGTLVELASENTGLSKMQEILVAKNRSLAGQTAPAHGLCLMKVYY